MTLVYSQSLRARDFNLPKVHPLASLLSPIRHQSVLTWKDSSSSSSTLLPEEMNPSYPPRRPEDPFDEHELVYMFAEIIRQARERPQSPYASRPASYILFEAIKSTNIEPVWDDLTLPNGRSIRSCRYAFQEYPRSGSGPPLPAQSPFQGVQPDPSRKRALPIDSQTAGGRILAPKPVAVPTGAQRSFAAVNLNPGSNPLSPLGGQAAPLGEPRKKRGRPSKKEQEERRLRLSEARPSESGPVHQFIPSPQLPPGSQYHSSPGEAPRSPVTAGMGPTGPVTTPQGASRAPSNNSSSSGKRRRGRPPKTPGTIAGPAFPLPERSEAYETPPQTASTREQRDSTTETLPREHLVESSSAADDQRGQTAHEEADEGRQPPRWQDTILRK